MQSLTRVVFNVRFDSGLLATLLSMNVAVVALGQEPNRTPALTKQSKTKLTVGTEVVFKTSQHTEGDHERQTRSTIHPPLVIDRVADNRVSISSCHKKRQQWVPLDQLIPFDVALDEITRKITQRPPDANLYASRARLWTNHGDNGRARADLD
jgi:hypothetical protein